MAMKLKNVAAPEKKVRLDFSLPESQATRLEQYRQFVAASSGADVSQRELLALLVTQFMDEDKDFVKAQQNAVPQPRHDILRGPHKEGVVHPQETP